MSLYFDEKEAIEELKRRGYRVTRVEYLEVKDITTIPQLVKFFYACRRKYHDEKIPLPADSTEDRQYLSDLVRSRQKLGLSRKMAVQEAAAIVEGMFRLEDQLGLRSPIVSPSLLTKRSFVSRVCMLMDQEMQEQREFEIIQEWNKYYNATRGNEEFQQAKEELKEILEDIHGGKKRGRRSTRGCPQGN